MKVIRKEEIDNGEEGIRVVDEEEESARAGWEQLINQGFLRGDFVEMKYIMK